MKNVSGIYLVCVLLCSAASAAGAQSETKCFRADWLQGARIINLRINGREVAGTFTVEGEGRGAGKYEFSGTRRGDALTVAFAGNRLPDVAPSEMRSLVWTLARDGGRELLRIKFRGRNYETNRYEDRLADFEPCEEAGYEAPAEGAGGADAISAIRRRYSAINRAPAKYRVVKKELSGFSTEGGELVAYLDGESVVKITATHFGETGRSFEEFYYWDGRLFFILHRRETYDEPMSGRVSKTAEERFYFNDGRLIRWLDSRGRAVAPGRGEYREAQARYLDVARRFVEGARSQKSTVEAPEPAP